MTDQSRPPGIAIGQIFLERAQFGHREDALMLAANTPLGEPNLLFSFEGGIAPDSKTAIVRVTVQSKREERPLYNIDVTMVALVQTRDGQENMPLEDYIRTAAPTMLYPFLREIVANLTWRGRFGPLWLVPMNIAAATAGPIKKIAPPTAKALPRIRRSRKAKKGAKARR